MAASEGGSARVGSARVGSALIGSARGCYSRGGTAQAAQLVAGGAADPPSSVTTHAAFAGETASSVPAATYAASSVAARTASTPSRAADHTAATPNSAASCSVITPGSLGRGPRSGIQRMLHPDSADSDSGGGEPRAHPVDDPLDFSAEEVILFHPTSTRHPAQANSSPTPLLV